MKPSIAFFDFDGTIYKGDSMLNFISYVKGRRFLNRNMLLLMPRITLMKLGLTSRKKTKEELLKRVFRGENPSDIQQIARQFAAVLDNSIFPRAEQQINNLLATGTEICVVSASCRLWLEPWCEQRGFKLICSEMEIKNGLFTGCLKGENCRGSVKAVRIQETYNLHSFDKIYCYGNDSGDKEMLALSNQPTLKLHINA